MNIDEAVRIAIENLQSGNLQDAELIFCEILKLQPTNVNALHFRGLIFYKRKEYDSAIIYINKALHYQPNYAYAHHNLGIILQDSGQPDEAIACYQKTLQINPNFADSYHNLGLIFQDREQYDDAINNYKKTLEINSNFFESNLNLGIIYKKKGQFNEALTYFQKADKIDPYYPGLFQSILSLFFSTVNFKQALEYFWSAWNKACPQKYKNISQPLWDGSDIKGRTVLIHASFGGFGDTINFIRYASLISQYGAKVIFECQKELITLCKNVEGIDEIIEFKEGSAKLNFDTHCPVFSLPIVFNTRIDTIPSKVPYITVNQILVKQWKDKMKLDMSNMSNLKIGLVWSSGRASSLKSGYCPLELFLPLARFPDISLYSLQKGEAAKQVGNPPEGMKLINYAEEINDFSDTAAIIENLDLVISVDTAVAHLAGALGKPVWTLLDCFADWRWLENRADSPWYPTMKLFRQPKPGDWESVIERVINELHMDFRTRLNDNKNVLFMPVDTDDHF